MNKLSAWVSCSGWRMSCSLAGVGLWEKGCGGKLGRSI
jgi:hypothetical protein